MASIPTAENVDPAVVALGFPPPIGEPPAPNFVVHGKGIGADLILGVLVRAGAVTVLLMLLALIAVLTQSAMPSIKTFGIGFLTGSEWRPNTLTDVPVRDANGHIEYDSDGNEITQDIPPAFGALPVIYGTAVSSALALLLAVPVSLGAAVFLVRIAPRWLVPPVSFLIEFLAAIPSIAYGLWGLFVLVPFLQGHFEPACRAVLGNVPGFGWLFYEKTGLPGHMKLTPISLTGSDMLCGSMVLAIMILPIITAISRDVLRQVPRAQIEGAVALGSTWWQSTKEMLKFSRSGLFGAVMLGLARAAGETMAITMVIGNNSQIKASLFAHAQTMSSLLACEFGEADGIYLSALCEVALVLLVMSLLFNIVARWLVVGNAEIRATA